jgi:hypothetical protein
VTRKPPPPAPAAVAAAPAARAAPVRASVPPEAPLDRVPLVPSMPSLPVRTVETLGPTETIVQPGPVHAAPEQRPIAAYQPTAPVERTVAPRKIAARTGGNGAADPRPGCAHLNFIAAARCEAAQCVKAPYNHHPHCNAVREQTRRDVARRNPTLGF